MFLIQKRVYAEDLQLNPEAYYLFSDNDQNAGHWEYRNYSNFVGIRTKKDEHNFDSSFWSDDTYKDNIKKIDEDYRKIRTLLGFMKPVIFSENTFQINFESYDYISPKTSKYIQNVLKKIATQRGYI